MLTHALAQDPSSRPKLDLVMQLLREGDTLKVTRLDRLSRSVLHLETLGAELRERGIGLHVRPLSTT
ncbi:recombinase family protein [Streptomyces sp. NBC_00885]|nr:recombinase family protein [Streptomyces sp. NBC_00885]